MHQTSIIKKEVFIFDQCRQTEYQNSSFTRVMTLTLHVLAHEQVSCHIKLPDAIKAKGMLFSTYMLFNLV